MILEKNPSTPIKIDNDSINFFKPIWLERGISEYLGELQENVEAVE